MLQVFVGFIPWIFYWSFSGPGLWTIAILGGLTAAAGLVSWRWVKRHDVKTMELVTMGYFAVHAILTLALGSPFLKTYGPIANSLVLAGMAFGTLAIKKPFTYQYAKEDWDKSYWDEPAFIKINEIITGVWGGIFIFNAEHAQETANATALTEPAEIMYTRVENVCPVILSVRRGIGWTHAAFPGRAVSARQIMLLKDSDFEPTLCEQGGSG